MTKPKKKWNYRFAGFDLYKYLNPQKKNIPKNSAAFHKKYGSPSGRTNLDNYSRRYMDQARANIKYQNDIFDPNEGHNYAFMSNKLTQKEAVGGWRGEDYDHAARAKMARFDAEAELTDNQLFGELRTFTPTNKGYFFGQTINKSPKKKKIKGKDNKPKTQVAKSKKQQAKKKAQARKKKK